MTLKAIILDVDEPLVNRESDEHLKAFNECDVIEYSEIGFQSATSPGLKALITLSEYTNKKNFKGVLVVLDHLSEDDQPFQIVNGAPATHKLVSVDYIKEFYECNR
mgnify:CR=1 FL=1